MDVCIRIESEAAKCKHTASLATLQSKDADTGYRIEFRRLSESFDLRTTEAAAQRLMLYTDCVGSIGNCCIAIHGDSCDKVDDACLLSVASHT